MRPRARPVAFLNLCVLFTPCYPSPLLTHESNLTRGPSAGMTPDENAGTNIMVSWLWGLVWGDDSTVTVVDRTPALTFNARPAAFGPIADVLGYLIKVEDFSVPCEDSGRGGRIDDRDDGGWWPGGGVSESEVDDAEEDEEQAGEEALEARQGCPRLCVHGPHEPEATETWIALVMRGGCTFVEKVREAQRFGAKGVVVGGANEQQDRHGDGLVQMYSQGDASDITIPSTYITHASYLKLSSLIASSNTSTRGLRTVSVEVMTDTSGWEWYSPLLTFLILLFLPSSLTLLTLFVHRIRAARAARRERAPEDVVLNLPWRIWEGQATLWELEKTLDNPQVPVGEALGAGNAVRDESETVDGTNLEELRCEPSTSRPRNTGVEANAEVALAAARKWYETQIECAICLEEFVKGDKVRVLPCRHIFHMDEVDDWLIRRKKLCPICKHDVTRPLFAASEQPFLSSSSQPDLATQAPAPEDSEPTEHTPLLQQLDPATR